jgi:fructoselysine-6-P-deglycase FrlB-like protein
MAQSQSGKTAEVTVLWKSINSGEHKKFTLTQTAECIGNVIECEPVSQLGERGKIRIHLDSGEVYHHDPKFSGYLRSTQIGELAKVHCTESETFN